jgi:hypothetical protein
MAGYKLPAALDGFDLEEESRKMQAAGAGTGGAESTGGAGPAAAAAVAAAAAKHGIHHGGRNSPSPKCMPTLFGAFGRMTKSIGRMFGRGTRKPAVVPEAWDSD